MVDLSTVSSRLKTIELGVTVGVLNIAQRTVSLEGQRTVLCVVI